MGLLEELKDLGADIDDGLKRIGGNEKLYTRLLGTFVKSIAKHEVRADFSEADIPEMIEKTHAIKGMAGNLSITPMFEAYSKIVDLLRTGKPEEAKPLIENILPVQEQILDCIKKHME